MSKYLYCIDGTMIRILFPRGISDLVVPLDDTNRTCEDLKWLCVEKLRAPGLLSDAIVEEEGLVDILPAFGLVKAENESVWLAPNYVFEDNNTTHLYKFRLRHRPPTSKIYIENKLLSEFFVLQALEDFLKGGLGKVMVTEDVPRDKIIKLILLALLLPSSLPLRNSEVIGKAYKVPNFAVTNYKKRFSKELYNQIVTTNSKLYRFVDHYCYYSGLCESLNAYKCEEYSVLFYKQEFIKLLLESYPSYCFERYTAQESENFQVEVKLVVYDEPSIKNRGEPGIYVGEIKQCVLADVDSITLKEPDVDGPMKRQWEVEINCRGPKSQDKALLFDDKDIATSFITMLQGYLTLCFRPDVNICRKFTSPSVAMRDNLKSFCPMTHNRAIDLLRNENLHKSENEWCKFLIYENMSMLSEDRFQVATSDPEPVCHIKCLNGKGFLLYSSSGSKEIPDHRSLRSHLTVEYGQQLRPDFVSQRISPESVFFVEKTFSSVTALSGEMDDSGNKGPTYSYILEEDLGSDLGYINSSDEHLKRRIVPVGEEKRIVVQLVARKNNYVGAMFSGMTKLARLYRLHPASVLGFYGPVFTQTAGSAYVLEHSMYGDLVEFIKRNGRNVSTHQKMKFALEVVKIFCTLTQRREWTSELPLLHGNIRGNNFWVFKRHDRYHLKLGDPGLVNYYNELPLAKPNNDERIPWLSPERRNNLAQVTIASECYAVATTISEIFLGTDDFRSVLQKLGTEEIRKLLQNDNVLLEAIFSRADFKFPLPDFSISDDDEVSKSVKVVITKLWDSLAECWHSEHDKRPCPVDLKNSLLDLEEESSRIREETGLEHLKAVVSQLHKEDGFSVQQRISQLSSMKECQEFLRQNQKYYVPAYSFTKSKSVLGQGYYGKVLMGELHVDGRLIPVAMKTSKPEHENGINSTERGELYKEFVKEFRLSASLNHPNIVRAMNWFLEGTQYWMIMEYMNAGNLSKFASVHKHRMSDPNYIKILLGLSLDIAKGMEFCEKMGVVHCDLAARNVLLHSDGTTKSYIAKVSDFGMSKVLNREKDYYYQQGIVGKGLPIFWYAPEYLIYEKDGTRTTGINYTTAGDIWAYGTTLWELFSKGRKPFNVFEELRLPKDSRERLYEYYMEDKKRWPREQNVNEDIYSVMMSCWNENESKRPQFGKIQEMIRNIQRKYK